MGTAVSLTPGPVCLTVCVVASVTALDCRGAERSAPTPMVLGAACGLGGLGAVWPGVGDGRVGAATLNPASESLQSRTVLAVGPLPLEKRMGGLSHPSHQHTYLHGLHPTLFGLLDSSQHSISSLKERMDFLWGLAGPSTLGTPVYTSPWQPPSCPQRHCQSLEERAHVCVSPSPPSSSASELARAGGR